MSRNRASQCRRRILGATVKRCQYRLGYLIFGIDEYELVAPGGFEFLGVFLADPAFIVVYDQPIRALRHQSEYQKIQDRTQPRPIKAGG